MQQPIKQQLQLSLAISKHNEANEYLKMKTS